MTTIAEKIDRIIEVSTRDCRRVSSGDIRELCKEIVRLREIIDVMDRKQRHGCYDASCSECDGE